jgi:uncharacterized protein YcgL (UPF0745 family)
MSEEDVSAWCSRYKDAKAMEMYIMVEQKEPLNQERFISTLAKSSCGQRQSWRR